MNILFHDRLWYSYAWSHSRTRIGLMWESLVAEGEIDEATSIIRRCGNAWHIFLPVEV